MVNEIPVIYIQRDYKVKEYKPSVIIGFNHDKFLTRLLELGHEYFDTNKVYAALFDVTPVDKIDTELKDYKEIIEKFPNDRVFGNSFYIGDFNKKDHISIVNQTVDTWGLEIIEVIK